MILVRNLLQQLNGNNILTILVLFVFLFSSAQSNEEFKTEFKNGRQYWIHIVESGNTLFGIKKKYGVDIPTIISHNQGMNEILNIGQKIYIPTGKTELEVKKNKAISHIIKKGETIYGLSKKYNCSQKEIIELNSGIENGLKIGQEVKIPNQEQRITTKNETLNTIPIKKIEIKWNDSIVNHAVLKHETLYSISKRYMVPISELKRFNNLKKNKIKKGSIIKIPLKKIEKYELIEKKITKLTNVKTKEDSLKNLLDFKLVDKDHYNIVIAMPFCLDKNKAVMESNSNSSQFYPYTKISLDFYMGVVLALDSLKDIGVDIVVDIIDTKKDTNSMKKFINSSMFLNADIIFGPFESKNIQLLKNNLNKNNQVRVIPPFSSNTNFVLNTPQMIIPVTPLNVQIQNLAKKMVINHAKHNVIVLKSGEDNDLLNTFKDYYNEEASKFSDVNSLKIATLSSSSGRNFANLIHTKDTNIIIVPTKSRIYASKAMTTLNKIKNKSGGYNDAIIYTYGLAQWERFEEIKTPYKIKLNFHYTAPYHLDYKYEATKKVVRSYRNKYNTDPNKFAIQGFDLTYYFLPLLFLNQKNKVIMNDFKMKNNEFSGQYNSNTNIIYYHNYSKIKQ